MCVCVCVCVYVYFILSFKYHVFNARESSVVFDGINLSVFNVMYHNGMNPTKTVCKVYCLYYLQISTLRLLVYLLTLRQRHGIYKGRVTRRQ